MTTSAKRSVDLRIGRFFGWFALSWTIAGLVLVLMVAPIARRSTCTSDTSPCTSWEFTAIPWWWMMLWSVSLVVAIAVCWPPSRWWTPQDRSGRPKVPGVFSTPEWLRGHALVAALVMFGPIVNYDPTTADLIGYAASIVVALIGVAVATSCIRRTADIIPNALHRGIAQGYDFWLLPSERRLRARYGGPRAQAPPTPAARAERARRITRGALVYMAWCAVVLCALPIAIGSVVLLTAQPEPEPGPFTFLLILAWVPWGFTIALLITFLAGIRYAMPGRRGGLRTGMLGLLALNAAAAAWYLIVGTPFYGGFTWGLGVLLVVQAAFAVAIVVRMLVDRRDAAPRRPAR